MKNLKPKTINKSPLETAGEKGFEMHYKITACHVRSGIEFAKLPYMEKPTKKNIADFAALPNLDGIIKIYVAETKGNRLISSIDGIPAAYGKVLDYKGYGE